MRKDIKENFKALFLEFITENREELESEVYRKLISYLPPTSLLSLSVNFIAHVIEEISKTENKESVNEGYQEILKNIEIECKPFL